MNTQSSAAPVGQLPPEILGEAPIIALENVSKHFGSRVAIDALTLAVPTGSLFGLLGHNGAGKSTIIGILLGQVLPDGGSIRIHGHDVLVERPRALAKVGAIYEAPAFYDYLSGERNLRILCEYSAPVDSQRLAEVVDLVGLRDRIADPVSSYSHGMRQRLALAQALLPQPDLLILDEPTEGLDPEGVVQTRSLLRKLHREWGMTILVSSHHLSEMEQICTHVAVMREGRLLTSGNWGEIQARGDRIVVRVDRQIEAQRALAVAALAEWHGSESSGRLKPGVSVADVAQWLVQNGYRVDYIGIEHPTLESFYLEASHSAAAQS